MVEETAAGGTCLSEESCSPRAGSTPVLRVGIPGQEKSLSTVPAPGTGPADRGVSGAGQLYEPHVCHICLTGREDPFPERPSFLLS